MVGELPASTGIPPGTGLVLWPQLASDWPPGPTSTRTFDCTHPVMPAYWSEPRSIQSASGSTVGTTLLIAAFEPACHPANRGQVVSGTLSPLNFRQVFESPNVYSAVY